MILLTGLILVCLIIAIHELGHFLAAKAMGVRVITFSIGMGPRVWSRKIGETVYCLAWLPLGGYVRPLAILPDQDNRAALQESPRTDTFLDRFYRWLAPTTKEERIEEDLSVLLESRQNLMSRGFLCHACFILAGSAANIASAFFLSALFVLALDSFDAPTTPPRIFRVAATSTFDKAGFRRGDIIEKVNDRNVHSWMDIGRELWKSQKAGKIPVFSVRENLVSSPRQIEVQAAIPIEYFSGKYLKVLAHLGVKPELQTKRLNVSQAVFLAKTLVTAAFEQILGTRTESNPSGKSVLRPGIESPAKMIMDIGFDASRDWQSFVCHFAAISICIALLNLLPVPGLDGGQFLLLVIERAFKIPITLNVRINIMRAVACLMLVLTVLGLGRDIFGI